MSIPRIAALFAAIVSLAGPVCAQEAGKAAAPSRMGGAALHRASRGRQDWQTIERGLL